jgi:peptide/nickel transport system permease protein
VGAVVAKKPGKREQSQSDLVWQSFRSRPLAMLAAGLILFLITVSIFAPFLANDRPFYFVGTNRFEYQETSRTMRSVIGQLAELAAKKPDAADLSQQIGQLRDNLPPQMDRLRELLIDADRKKWDEFAGRLKGASLQGVSLDAVLLKELQKEFRVQFSPEKIELSEVTKWPVLASLSPLDLWFMAANVLGLGLVGLKLLPETIRPWIRIRWWVLVVIPTLAAVGWWWLVPARLDRTNYKQGVLAGSEGEQTAPVIFKQVVWPAIPFGLDEDQLEAKSQPPYLTTKEMPKTKRSPWDSVHWLGTDEIGRDVLCRMIWGGRVSLSVGIVAVAIYVVLGIIIGSIAGYFRGWVDLLISRLIEVVICFPAFFLILTIVAFMQRSSLYSIMVVIGITSWTGIARLVRGEFLRLVDQEFVLAGRALGYSSTRLIFGHVLPNALAPVLVSATFGVAGAILTESGLSFLGLGISSPTPSWGAILANGRENLFRAPWLIQFPGLAIFLTITAYNIVGETLRDASDPRLRGGR